MSALVERTAAGFSCLVREGGDAIPIVLLHGIGSNAQSFAPLMRIFDARHPMMAWDAPGYGSSEPLTIEWPDASDYAAALDRLLVELGIARCVLVGHSLGCLMSARYALVAPKKVATLVLISPALGYGAEKDTPLPAGAARRVEELDRLGPAKFAAERAPGLGPEETLAICARIRCPVLVIQGTDDAITGRSRGTELARAIPGARLELIEGGGHIQNARDPVRTNLLIRDFVRGLEAAQ